MALRAAPASIGTSLPATPSSFPPPVAGHLKPLALRTAWSERAFVESISGVLVFCGERGRVFGDNVSPAVPHADHAVGLLEGWIRK